MAKVDNLKESMKKSEEVVEKRNVEYQTLMRGACEKVIQEHKAGFDKAIQQVKYKFKILVHVEIDIFKYVHERILKSINDISK